MLLKILILILILILIVPPSPPLPKCHRMTPDDAGCHPLKPQTPPHPLLRTRLPLPSTFDVRRSPFRPRSLAFTYVHVRSPIFSPLPLRLPLLPRLILILPLRTHLRNSGQSAALAPLQRSIAESCPNINQLPGVEAGPSPRSGIYEMSSTSFQYPILPLGSFVAQIPSNELLVTHAR